MTKARLLAVRCENSPTGAHWWVMSWPEPGVYQGVCKYCGAIKHEDAFLGLGDINPEVKSPLGRKSELRFRCKRGRFMGDD